MHRSYNSILPTHNKLLQKKWDQTYYDEHRRKVHTAAPMVDTRAPPTYMHLHLKLKKLQLEEERLATIERDNRILLEKMSYIMRTQGRVDNHNVYEYKSLNREKRQNELLRVTKDNQEILRRITIRKPEYSAKKWQDEWDENQQFMDNISHFPVDWWKLQRQETRGRSCRESRKGTGTSKRKSSSVNGRERKSRSASGHRNKESSSAKEKDRVSEKNYPRNDSGRRSSHSDKKHTTSKYDEQQQQQQYLRSKDDEQHTQEHEEE